MYTDPNAMMIAALNRDPRALPERDQVMDENQDFQVGKRWDDAYPWKSQEYQQHFPQQTTEGLFGVPPQRLQQMAGEVKPMYPAGMEPANAGGRSMDATAYAWGNKSAPNVNSIGIDTMKEWLDRQRLKLLAK